jgi:chromosomal replication initiator protein
VLKTTLRHHLEQVYADQDLASWFDPLDVSEDPDNNTIRISFPHALFGQWFMHTVRQDFESHAGSFLQAQLIYDCPSHLLQRHMPEMSKDTYAGKRNKTSTPIPAKKENSSFLPSPCHTFASFLVNKKNDFPLAAAKKAVLQANNPPHSPLIIYGLSGSGKTHLLDAMVNAVKNEFPHMPIHYGDMDIVGRMTPYDIPAGHAVFLDDIQRINLFPDLQDKFALLLDRLSQGKGFVVCTFDNHPSSCPNLLPKLLSRLSSGLVLELKKPDLDIRRRYIQAKNEEFGFGFSREQELIMAQRYQDFRSLDGFLARIITYRSTMNQNADLSAILEKETEQKILTPTGIIAAISLHYDVSPDMLTEKNRTKTLILPRQIAIFLTRELLGLSLVHLGQIFGGRDHSSIIYSIKKIEELRKRNKDIHKTLTELKHLCLSRI